MSISPEIERLKAELRQSEQDFSDVKVQLERLHKQLEIKLHVREDKYRTILESITEGYYEADLEGNFTFFNASLCQISGFSKEEILGSSYRLFTDDASSWKIYTIFKEVYQTGKPSETFEATFMRKNGGVHTAEISVTLIRNSSDEPVGFRGLIRDVTARHQAEADLQAAYQRLNAIVDFLPDPTLGIDADKRVIIWNRAIEDMTGIKAPDMLGKGDYAYTVPFYGEARPLLMDLLWQDTEDVTHKYPFIKREGRFLSTEVFCPALYDGRGAWVFAKASPLYDAKGNLSGAIESIRDITERKQAEEELQHSEKRFRLIVDNAPVGIIISDKSEQVLFVNRKFVELFGHTHNDIPSVEAWWPLAYPDVIQREQIRERWQAAIQTAIQTHSEAAPMEASVTCRNGRVRQIEFRLASTGELNVVMLTDVTERHVIAAELERKHAELLSLFDTIDGIIYVADMDTYEIIYTNKAFEKAFQQPLIGQICYQVLQERTTPCDFCTNAIIRQKNYQPHHWEHYNPVLNITYQVIDRVIQWPDGREVRFEMAFDISRLKHAEEQKAQLEKQLAQAQKMEAVGTLAGGIAHDFNNILQIINGFSQLVLMNQVPDSKDYAHVQQILKSGERAGQLVRQLLLFSRKMDGQRHPLNLNHAVAEAMQVLRRTIPLMITIESSLADQVWPVNADPVQMEQVLLNLGSNAADAMPDGGSLRIETGNIVLDKAFCQDHLEVQPGRYVLMTVSDTGSGMDPKTLQHIFDPFFTTKEIGKGTGLGLPSVFGIVKGHGGFITCASMVEQGTSFKIYLPALAGEPVPKERSANPQVVPGGSETILLVDDDDAVQQATTDILAHFGYTVLLAQTGEEALETYQNREAEIDLVILDLGMPGMGGRRCLQELLQRNPDVKVLIASGYAAKELEDQTRQSGAAGYIAKPYNLRKLLAEVRRVLDGGVAV